MFFTTFKMSKIISKINQDSINALKDKDELKISTLRMLKSSLHNLEIEKQSELYDGDIFAVLQKEINQRNDSITQFKQAGRNELAEKEENEIKIISNYLPEQMGDEELIKIVESSIAKIGAKEMKDFGAVMKEIMPQVKGKATGDQVSAIVKQKLGGE